MLRLALFVACWLAACLATAQERMPKSLDPRLKIELFAQQPQIVTPTGLDVDAQGRVWAIESNTHFPPPDYAGHKTDRLLVLPDANGDGQADEIVPFADGFTHAMSVDVRPSGEVYLATRRQIVQLIDRNQDLRCDEVKTIVNLDTPGNYPHNGLAGFAWDAQGWMYFGFGENLGAKYTIRGSDGSSHAGGAEGGNIYRCRPDGSKLALWATGFWNPHASCVDAQGRMFTVDNDPDSRPPCRLLYIIAGGDYGYRFRNGRKGLHPFTSWNGEIPGTLPMVAGTGEAPSGIVAYESSGLPEEYLGNLLVTSWGDHRIDRFRLKAKGASYESLAEPLIVGGESFRPVGLAVAPDGSLYCTDWVLKDYKLHGKGRVWRISSTEQSAARNGEPAQPDATPEARTVAKILKEPRSQLVPDSLSSEDPFVFSAAVRAFGLAGDAGPRSRQRDMETLPKSYNRLPPALLRTALGWLLAARQQDPKWTEFAELGLKFPDAVVRRAAAQWVGEEKLLALRPQVEALLSQEPITADLFLGVLAALELLDGKDPANFDKTPAGKYVVPILLDAKRPIAVRTQSLRLIAPDDPAIKAPLLEGLLASEDKSLRLEAIRTLQASTLTEAATMLGRVALDESESLQMRAEAMTGLARAKSNETREVAQRLLASSELPLVVEALRALPGYAPTLHESLLGVADRFPQAETGERLARLLPEKHWPDSVRKARDQRPANVPQWMSAIADSGDSEAGRRVFFHPLGAGCWKCHTVNGRGGAVGPDLSMIARTMDRQKLAQSILEPSKEIAPQFTTWNFVMTSGQTHQGMLLGDTRDDKQRIGLADDGRQMDLRVSEIELREPSNVSIMPVNLIEQLTVAEFRHLLAYLESLR